MGLILLRKQPQKLAVVRQYLVTILASFPFAVAGAAVIWPSPTLPKILTGEDRISLDITEVSWMVSLLYFGEAVGALPSVYLSSKFGPKKTLLYSGVFPIISWSIILSSETALSLYVSRFLSGLQMGVITIVYPLYVSDISQTDIRAPLTAINNITFNAGLFFVVVVGPFVSFRVLISLFVFLSGLFPISFRFAPESPLYMLSHDDITRARKSLQWLRGDLNRIELEFELSRLEKVVDAQSQEEGSMMDIFCSKTLRKDLVAVVILSALDGFPRVSVILAYATLTFPKTAFGILTPNDCMIILCSVTFISSFIATYVSEMFQGKKLGVASYCVCSSSMGAVAVWLFLRSKSELNVISVDFVPFLGCLVHLVICSFFHSNSLKFINNHEFSTKLSKNFTLLSTFTKAVTCFVFNRIYLEMAYRAGTFVNFVIYSVGCIVAASSFAIFWVPMVAERSLEEEQENSTEDEISKSSMTGVNETF